jgi:Helicase associated domain
MNPEEEEVTRAALPPSCCVLPTTVYGVRRGKAGVRGCIFLRWEDCAPFVVMTDDTHNDCEDEDEWEYQCFSNVMDAAHYIVVRQLEETATRPSALEASTALLLQEQKQQLAHHEDSSNLPIDKDGATSTETLESVPLAESTINNNNNNSHPSRVTTGAMEESTESLPQQQQPQKDNGVDNTTTTAKKPPKSTPKTKNRMPQKKASAYWMQQYEEFKQSVEAGSAMDMMDMDPKVAKFIKEQRLEYRYMKQRLETKMSRDKIAKMEALGFDWQYETLLEEDNLKWEAMLHEFMAYHAPRLSLLASTSASTTTTTAAAVVPKKQSAALRDWKHQQRVQFQNLQEGKRSSLTPDRIRKLNDAGFIFQPRANFRTLSWKERIQQLQDYKKVHGNLNIPANHAELGHFTGNIRRAYKYLQEGKKTGFTQAKATQLEQIGFSFLVGKRKANPVEMKTWEEQFDLLRQFKQQTGHTIVPQHFPGLGRWVKQMRREFKLMKENKRTTLTSEKVMMLADIGFVFDAGFRRGSKLLNNKNKNTADTSKRQQQFPAGTPYTDAQQQQQQQQQHHQLPYTLAQT